MDTSPQPLGGKIRKKPLARAYRVLVLYGGWSGERAVSLESGKGVAEALRILGQQVELLDPKERNAFRICDQIAASFSGAGPEIIFNILHGHDVEDGVLQGLLELTNLPYTFSGVTASAVAMDKGVSRAIMQRLGIACPPGQIKTLDHYRNEGQAYPHIIKPLSEGSSLGTSFLRDEDAKKQALQAWTFGEQVLVEDYIPGREIQVAVFSGKAMGAVELCFPGEIFSYEAKYTPGFTKHIVNPDVPADVLSTMASWSECAFLAFGCRGVARVDFRYDPSAPRGQNVFCLELNTQPGFTSISLVPDIARYYGWSYEDVVAFLVSDALTDKEKLCEIAQEERPA